MQWLHLIVREIDLILKYYFIIFGNYIKSNKTSSGQNTFEQVIQILQRRILDTLYIHIYWLSNFYCLPLLTLFYTYDSFSPGGEYGRKKGHIKFIFIFLYRNHAVMQYTVWFFTN